MGLLDDQMQQAYGLLAAPVQKNDPVAGLLEWAKQPPRPATVPPSANAALMQQDLYQQLNRDPVAAYGFDPSRVSAGRTITPQTFGQFDPGKDQITIDPNVAAGLPLGSIIDTIIHESRHRAMARLRDNHEYWKGQGDPSQERAAFAGSLAAGLPQGLEEIVNRYFDASSLPGRFGGVDADMYLGGHLRDRATADPLFKERMERIRRAIQPEE
jgi:hypothetical protein